MKTILSGLALAGTIAVMVGAIVGPSAALPVMHPQTSQAVAYWHHHHWWRHHHHHYHHGGGISIHL